MKEKLFDIKFWKFVLVGVINTIVGAGIMFLLYNLCHCNYWVSSACNYIAGGICSFLLNKFFTFQNKEKNVKQVIQFIILLIGCYLIAYVAAKYVIYYLFSREEKRKFKEKRQK